MRLGSSLLFFLACTSGTASAHEVDADDVLPDIAEVRDRTELLADALSRSQGLLNEREAMAKYEAALFAWMTGDVEDAAQRFWVLRERLAPGPLRQEAEFYLADSLRTLGSPVLADQVYTDILGVAEHAFAESAAHGWLLLAAEHQTPEAFESLYVRLSADHRVPDSPRLQYTLGKAYWHLKNNTRSDAAFAQINDDSTFFARATYFRGVLALLRGESVAAEAYFATVTALPAEEPVAKRTVDLANLAIARMAAEEGRWNDAVASYKTIDDTSEMVAEAWVEHAFAEIQRENDEEAQAIMARYLERFPNAAAAARIELTRAHLYARVEDWTSATAIYQDVVDRYGDLGADLSRLMREDATLHQRVLDPNLEVETALPTWATAMAARQPNVQTSATLRRDLEDELSNLGQAEQLVVDVQDLLSAQAIPERHRHWRAAAYLALAKLAETELQLTEMEIKDSLSGKSRREALDPLHASGREVSHALRDLRRAGALVWGGTETKAKIVALVDQMRDASTTARSSLSQTHGSAHTHIDEMHADLRNHDRVLRELLQSIDAADHASDHPIRAALTDAQAELARARTEGAQLDRATATVWDHARGTAADAVGGFIDGSVQKAMVGLSDAAWNRWINTEEQFALLSSQRAESLADIQRRFGQLKARTR